jgi:5-methylcytosine-specific restriction endonuclease McrA
MTRCMVLNASFEFLTIVDRWIDALSLVLAEKAIAIEHYPDIVRSQREQFRLPAVVVMRYQVNTQRKRHLFDAPSRKAVFIRDNFRCQYCGAKVTMRTGTRDHVVPRSRGGRDVLSNIVAACVPCNTRKDARTPEEAGMPLLNRPRSLTEEEKLRCLLRVVRSKERSAWMECLKKHGITLWAA